MSGSGIYKIQSICKPERAYIGSAVDFKNRWRVHLCNLRKGIHHSPKLQNHYNKYGESDLIFRIIEPCLPQFLIAIEDTYLHPVKPYFNVCSEAGSSLGYKHSEETHEKLRNSHKGPRPYRIGIKLPLVSEKMRGNQNGLGNKGNIGHEPWNKGKTGVYSEKVLKKMRNRRQTEETINKLRIAWIKNNLKKVS